MLNLANETLHPRKTLTKVRRNFLRRIPEENNSSLIDLSDPSFDDHQVHLLNPSLGLVELDGKICIGTQYLNSYLSITSSKIERYQSSKVVTLSLEIRKDFSKELEADLENNLVRLEMSENLELIDWANRIRKNRVNHPKIMQKYFSLLSSDDSRVIAELRRTRNKAALAYKKIENTHFMYRKRVFFLDRKSMRVLSCTFSEGLLAHMGHSLEGFVDWSKDNGVPLLCEENCSNHLEVAKRYLDHLTLSGSPIQEGVEYSMFIFNKEGKKTEVLAKHINIIEPAPEGLFHTGYIIINPKKIANEEKMIPKIIPEHQREIHLSNQSQSLVWTSTQQYGSVNDFKFENLLDFEH